MKERIRRSCVQLICGQAKAGANLTFLKNMALFCKEFNEKTKNRIGEIVTVEITVYKDKSYDYSIDSPPSVCLLKNRGSDWMVLKNKGTQGREERKKLQESERKEISEAELERIAREKLPYLNTDDLEKAKKIVAGTVRSFNGFKINKEK